MRKKHFKTLKSIGASILTTVLVLSAVSVLSLTETKAEDRIAADSLTTADSLTATDNRITTADSLAATDNSIDIGTGYRAADDNFGTDNPVTEISVSKTVNTTPGTVLPTETFQIKIRPAEEDELYTEVNGVRTPVTTTLGIQGLPIKPGIELKDDTIFLDFDASDDTSSGSVTKTGKFTLDFESEFTESCVYRYYVSEIGSIGLTGAVVTEDNGYITYDKTEYIVDLFVFQKDDVDDSGTPQTKYVVVSAISHVEGTDVKTTAITFTSEIQCNKIRIYKRVDGTPYQADELFDFRILIPVGGDTIKLREGETILAKIYDSSGQVIDTEHNRTDENGNVILRVQGADIDADMKTYGNEFQLKDGEWLELTSVPVTMIYKVQEVTDTEEFGEKGYIVSCNYTETGANDTITKPTGGKLYIASDTVRGTTNTLKNEIIFYNTRLIEHPDSGIIFKVLPYVVILLLAAAGLVIFHKVRIHKRQ